MYPHLLRSELKQDTGYPPDGLRMSRICKVSELLALRNIVIGRYDRPVKPNDEPLQVLGGRDTYSVESFIFDPLN